MGRVAFPPPPFRKTMEGASAPSPQVPEKLSNRSKTPSVRNYCPAGYFLTADEWAGRRSDAQRGGRRLSFLPRDQERPARNDPTPPSPASQWPEVLKDNDE